MTFFIKIAGEARCPAVSLSKELPPDALLSSLHNFSGLLLDSSKASGFDARRSTLGIGMK
jgi:hypothetical protein